MSSRSRRKKNQQRARYARTNGDLLVGGDIPSGQQPSTIWWWGSDTPYTSTGSSGGLSAVTRATSLICDTIAALPWRVLSSPPEPAAPVVPLPVPRWLADPMLHRPDARFGPSPAPAALRLARASFWSQWMRSAIMKGRGCLIFEEGADGAPVAGTMRLLNPDAVAPVDRPYIHRRIGAETDPLSVETDYDGRFDIGGRTHRLLELLNPMDAVDEYGLARGVLEKHAAETGMAQQQLSYGRRMYRSGVPAGYLKVSVPNYSKDQAEALKARWLDANGGDERSIAVLNATTDFQPLAMSPVDMALIESRKMTLVDIANMFGVPVYHLNGGDSGGLTYSTAESRSRDLITYTLMPWANAAEDMLTGLLPAGQYVEVGFTGLLRADTKTRYDAYSTALRDGWMSIDEVRAVEGLAPIGPAPGAGEGRQG